MKKILLISFTLILSIIFVDNLKALQGYTTGTDIFVRKEPSVSSEFIGVINSKNTILDLVEDKLYNEEDTICKIGWYKINYKGSTAYVCGDYVSIGAVSDNNPDYNTDEYEARIYGDSINVYSTPGGGSYKKLLPGTNLIIIGNKVSGSGCAAGYYKVKYFKNELGYVCSSYVRTKEELTASDEEYEKTLKASGFPDTYIPYLVKLHKLHPNWKFNAINTNLNWDHVVSMEERRNYINNVYLNPSVQEVYSLGPGTESGWSISTNGINAFFLDPRNFLTEKFIFMFESLGYKYNDNNRETLDKENTRTKDYYNSITSMLGNSFLNTDEYKYYFIEAGFQYGVSPIHLIGRVIQEGASNGEYVTIIGNNNRTYNGIDLNGYYNFYNIGSKVDNITSNPTTRGLAYACGTACGNQFTDKYGQPWDTREKAIKGGAQFISGDYISQGQDTLYFQKFDLKNFWHQYQTNINAPGSEGIDAFLAYQKAGIVDSALEFDIPIYNNMPSVVSLPLVASIINTLDDIKVDGKSISGYDIDVVDYTFYVKATQTSVKIEGTKTDPKSTVTGLGTINLTENETDHSIVVTAENGAKKTYRIKFIKIVDTRPDALITIEDIISKLSVKVNDNTMNHISPETVANTLIQSIQKVSPNTTVTIYNKSGNPIEGASLIETGGQIKITVPSGSSTTFTTIITGDTNGDGQVTILDLLQIQKHILKSTILTDARYKAADVSSDGEITILDLLRVQKAILGDLTL